MSRAAALLVMWGAVCLAQRINLKRVTVREYQGATFRGGAMLGSQRLVSWGDRVRVHGLPRGKVLEEAIGHFGAGGCVADINGDGREDLVLLEIDVATSQERASTVSPLGRMVWLEAPDWRRHLIDTEADFDDCLATTIWGRRGVLVLHRRAQVRFYEIPAKADERWPYREIYSIYTPSAQGGLLRADVDADGHADIVSGNYWLQAPEKEQDSWRLFAINNWWEAPHSAMLRLALVRSLDSPFPILFAAQSSGDPARVAWFERKRDPRDLWIESKLEAVPPVRKPAALAVADFNGDMRPDLALGENAGEGSRLLLWWSIGSGRYQAMRIDLTQGLIGLWPVDFDGDGNLDLVGLGPRAVMVWRGQRRR